MPSDNDETYNGWTNRETWLVALWIDNDEGLSAGADALAQEYPVTGATVRDWIEDSIWGFDGVIGGSLTADLILDALSRVNWDEIASDVISPRREQPVSASGYAGTLPIKD